MADLFTLYEDETREIPFAVKHPNGNPYNLTGRTVEVAFDYDGITRLLLKTSASAAEVVIDDAVNGTGRIKIVPADFDILTPDRGSPAQFVTGTLRRQTTYNLTLWVSIGGVESHVLSGTFVVQATSPGS